jgi:hypothetical protein
MSLFSKKIKCGLCNKFHKKKTQRKLIVYCCSTYDNKGSKFCKRLPIREEVLLDYLQLRLRENPSEKYIHDNVELVEVYPDKVTIHIKNENPIVVTSNLLDLG